MRTLSSGARRSVSLLVALTLLLAPALAPFPAAADGAWEIRSLNGLAYARSLTLDADGYPHVAYAAWHSVNYAHEDAAGWHDVAVATHAWFDFTGVAVALDGAGAPEVAFSQWTPSAAQPNPDPPVTPHGAVMWAVPDGAAWLPTVVQGADEIGYTLMANAVTAAGARHVLFTVGGVPSSLWYGAQSGADAWALTLVTQTAPITGTWGVGAGDLALDALGRPVVSYRGHDATGPYIGVARLEGATWNQLLRVEGDQAHRTALAVAPDGTLHLLYAAATRPETVLISTLKHDWLPEGGSWESEVIGDGRFDGDIAADGAGALHAAWLAGDADLGYGALTYARRVDGAWVTETVGANASGPFLALDGSGKPHLVYDVGNDLRYARRAPNPPRFAAPAPWLNGLGAAAGGWTSQNGFPRLTGDVDGDGDADVVAFGSKGVFVSLSDGARLGAPVGWVAAYTPAQDWTNFDMYPRWLADVDGDGKDDIVGFGSRSVYVSRSTGSSFNRPAVWLNAYGPTSGGWSSFDLYPRVLGDVDGDGKADIVAFGNRAVYVSRSTGSGFTAPAAWIAAYGPATGGWNSQNTFPRWVADVNADGKADIVAFGNRAVYVSLSTGSGFTAPAPWLNGYGPATGGWTSFELFPRWPADVNADGKADIVAFGNKAAYVSLSTGAGFGPPIEAVRAYGPAAGGWSGYDLYPRLLGDLTGDGRADVIGFGARCVYVSSSVP